MTSLDRWGKRTPDLQQRLGQRIAALDGLRGIAILLLVLAAYLSSPQPSALDPNDLPPGLLGIAELLGFGLFLALSGYLLTAHLWRSMHRPSGGREPHWLRRFYLGRALRIFPLYDAVLLLATLMAVARGTPISELGPLKLYTWFVGNLPFLAAHAAQQPSPLPIRHLWAVAVMFQLACAWPLLLWSAQGRRRAVTLALGLVLTSIAFCWIVWGTPFRPGMVRNHLFDLFPLTWAAPFGLGAAIALARDTAFWPRVRRWLRAMAASGLAGCLLAVILRQTVHSGARTVFLFGSPSAGLAAAAAVALALDPGRLRAALAAWPLVWLGRLSFGIYLLHPLVLPIAGRLAHPIAHTVPSLVHTVTAAVALCLTLLLAFLSYELLELPALLLREKLEHR